MSDLNQCTITGRLGADVEIRRTQDGKPIANLRVASAETWRDRNSGERKEKTEWFNVVIFSEGLCKVAEQYLKKGSHVLLQGKIATRKWQDQSGNDRYSTELVLQGFDAKLIMLDGPSGEGKQQRRESEPQSGHDHQDGTNGGSYMRDLNDDIPFSCEWR
ncbi:single-stranded DNA-binding protein [Sinorhizobium meliloti]|uniref:single-stranded DNA-binding protein n=1 Tax=Rhizobium meliloti TaxID=382 RepID=UPI000B49D36E|nr:single-stranded DNA-binding protein [Sinorhizobium meliloti]ASQ10192.1 single-stranded DNA-binding protein [Sinorhizobium meliloti]ASQ11873.1 single-stranded DNA-binding protein [Sinorhizobium meliloti]MQU82950.1 single-stranded DNA-binding protein [Sinorhizobium meliloti]MQU83332.1 single-stranded DNA-binding protein [Sinorhizobium meliloti]MQU83644.1 single-stranded DNA-binding protein [Sinorhizobium meliloti]